MNNSSTYKKAIVGVMEISLAILVFSLLTIVSHASSFADAAFNGFNSAFLVQSGSQNTYYKETLNTSSYAGSWEQGLLIQVAEDAYDRNPSLANKQLVSDLCTTFLAKENYDWANDTWNDDIAWMTMALVHGYRITGNTAFLNKAADAWNMAYNRGWDSTFGGGIWEDMNQKDAKCALSNDPMIVVGINLYQITGQSAYLTKCQSIYSWVRSYIFNTSNGQINEGINYNGVISSDNVYNSGSFIYAAALLYKVTGTAQYYNDAVLAADHVKNNNGIVIDTRRGANLGADLFARGLAYLCNNNNLWGRYQSWVTTQCNASWNVRRTDKNVTWNNWANQTPTSDVSAMECLGMATLQQDVPVLNVSQPANGTYKVVNRNSGLVLNASGGYTGNGTLLQQWGYDGTGASKWVLTSLGNAQYRLIGVGSGRAVDVPGASMNDSVQLQLYDWNNTGAQKWMFIATDNGYYEIVNANSGKVMDVRSGSTANGAAVQQYGLNTSYAQQWIVLTP